jgi:hypothetical protein
MHKTLGPVGSQHQGPAVGTYGCDEAWSGASWVKGVPMSSPLHLDVFVVPYKPNVG